MTTARRANAQIRRLRAALEQARGVMAVHFGEDDPAVRACDRALNPAGELSIGGEYNKLSNAFAIQSLLPWQIDIIERLKK